MIVVLLGLFATWITVHGRLVLYRDLALSPGPRTMSEDDPGDQPKTDLSDRGKR